MAAAHGEIAGGAVAAAVGAAPRGPARLIDRRRRWGRLQHRGVGLRDVRRHGFALGRKAERRTVGAADPAAPIDEGIYRRQHYRLKGRRTIANELRPQVEFYAVVEIIQPGPEVARQAECLQILEPARAPVVGRQNGVAAREIDAWEEDRRDGAVQRGVAAHIGPRSRQRVHLHDVESVALNCEIAGDRHGAGRVAGNEEAAGIDNVEPTVPLPRSTAPLFTVVRLDRAIEPSTTSAPAFTMVDPV